MIVDELFLNCSIKPFHMGIHLGGSGIGMPVVFMQSSYSPHRSACCRRHRLRRDFESFLDPLPFRSDLILDIFLVLKAVGSSTASSKKLLT